MSLGRPFDTGFRGMLKTESWRLLTPESTLVLRAASEMKVESSGVSKGAWEMDEL